ncbi:hypothetical protein FW755_03305 [Lonepinella koalarum]|uniref:Uncharacterized protein n=1 Tax=Lonepinella koalarum TaxID=53417 RepID=A0A4R1KME2_9PAST|nr:hypothetical protein [Lonepinella koalarum]MDH2927332.1 hypothetical protein [Lonepinella koalarum]TCK64939.1 hypothetical protein EV692_2424 [Lonepinella koalarum]TFJ88806.1 hypothetical protein E0709_11785 [Lonepinella koalarum]TYG34184.1 hypothetical protein FW755_03305 [Lonepinella koalarum]
MKCKCPACGAVLSLDVLLQHEQASQAVFSALSINGEFGRLAVQYLGLFRPEKTMLTMERLTKVLNELLDIVNAGGFKRNGQQVNTSLDSWIDGLNAVLTNRHAIKRPLTSHNYLLEVVSQRQGRVVRVINHAESRRFESKTGKAVASLVEFANE